MHQNLVWDNQMNDTVSRLSNFQPLFLRDQGFIPLVSVYVPHIFLVNTLDCLRPVEVPQIKFQKCSLFFSVSVCQSLSCVRLFATPWTLDFQAPLPMGFSRQEYWSGLPFPSPGDLPNPGIEPRSYALQTDSLLCVPSIPLLLLVTFVFQQLRIYFTYHKSHPFKVYSSVPFSIFIELYNYQLQTNFRTFLTLCKGSLYSAVTANFAPLSPSPLFPFTFRFLATTHLLSLF